MRKLATVLSLLVLCVGTSSAQWNLAQDPAATLLDGPRVAYDVAKTTSGFDVLLKSEAKGGVTDEISIWRTGTGSTAYTVADIAVFDPTLSNMPVQDAIVAQCEAAILTGVASGLQRRPASGVTQTKAWFNENGKARSMNFEIRWDASGTATLTRLPDDVVSGTVQ